jgi:hypothetical protein
MLQLQDLTIGYVSGMIAAAIFVGRFKRPGVFLCAWPSSILVRIIIVLSLQPVQLFIPIALPVILLGLLKEKNSTVTTSAVTW